VLLGWSVKNTFPFLSTAGPSVKIKPLPILMSLASFLIIKELSSIWPKEKFKKSILIKKKKGVRLSMFEIFTNIA
jgi:hypothetical protein